MSSEEYDYDWLMAEKHALSAEFMRIKNLPKTTKGRTKELRDIKALANQWKVTYFPTNPTTGVDNNVQDGTQVELEDGRADENISPGLAPTNVTSNAPSESHDNLMLLNSKPVSTSASAKPLMDVVDKPRTLPDANAMDIDHEKLPPTPSQPMYVDEESVKDKEQNPHAQLAAAAAGDSESGETTHIDLVGMLNDLKATVDRSERSLSDFLTRLSAKLEATDKELDMISKIVSKLRTG